jgi:hypothetical protein
MQKRMKVTNKNRRRKRIKKLEPVGSRISRRKLKKNKEDGRTDGTPEERKQQPCPALSALEGQETVDARGEEENEDIGLNINAIVCLKRKQKTRKNQGKQVKVVPFGE